MSRKAHPTKEGISADTDGNIYHHNIKCDLWHNAERDIVMVTIDRSSYSAAKMILECHVALPKTDRRYSTKFKDGNRKNIKLSNLEWNSDHIPKRKRIQNAIARSGLSREATLRAYNDFKAGKITVTELAKKHGTSETSIRRAFVRAEKIIKG